MKKALFLLAMLLPASLLALPLVSHAGVSVNVNVPGMSLQIGDRDDRGYYWAGDRWREPRWWHARYPRGYYYGPPARVCYAPPPRAVYYGPPRGKKWHGRKYYRMPPPPPGYYYHPGPRW